MDNNQDDISVILGYDASKLDAQEKSIIDKINKFAKSIGSAAKGIDISVDTEKLKSDIKKATASSNKDFISASRERTKAQEMLNRNIVNMEIQLAGTTTKIQSNMLKERILATRKAVDEQSFLYKKDAQNFIDANKKKIAESNKAQKEFARTSGSVLSSDTGTTFGHKALTTSQYMIAGAALYKTQEALRAVISESMAYDDAIYSNMAVLQINRVEAENLADANRKLAISYGGAIKDIDELTLSLGRAGVEYENLADASEVAVSLARITGDTYKETSLVLSTFITAFIKNNKGAGVSVEELGNKLAYMANESKLSVDDLGTVGNYALTTAASLNLTVDSIGALITGLSNIGMSASTIGTQIRKLEVVFKSQSKNIREFWQVLGEDQNEFLKKIKSSEDGLIGFLDLISKDNLSDNKFEQATRNMEILTRSLVTALREGDEVFIEHYYNIQNSLDATTQAQLKSLSATVLLERAWNSLSTVANGAVTNLLDSTIRSDANKLGAAYTESAEKLSKYQSELVMLKRKYKDTAESQQEYILKQEQLANQTIELTDIQDRLKVSLNDIDDMFDNLPSNIGLASTAIGALFLAIKGHPLGALATAVAGLTMSMSKTKDTVTMLHNAVVNVTGALVTYKIIQSSITSGMKAMAAATALASNAKLSFTGILKGFNPIATITGVAIVSITTYLLNQKKTLAETTSTLSEYISELKKLSIEEAKLEKSELTKEIASKNKELEAARESIRDRIAHSSYGKEYDEKKYEKQYAYVAKLARDIDELTSKLNKADLASQNLLSIDDDVEELRKQGIERAEKQAQLNEVSFEHSQKSLEIQMQLNNLSGDIEKSYENKLELLRNEAEYINGIANSEEKNKKFQELGLKYQAEYLTYTQARYNASQKLGDNEMKDAKKLQEEWIKVKAKILEANALRGLSGSEKELVKLTYNYEEDLSKYKQFKDAEQLINKEYLIEKQKLESSIATNQMIGDNDFLIEKISLENKSLENQLKAEELRFANKTIEISQMDITSSKMTELIDKEIELFELRNANVITEDKIAILEEEGEAYRSLIDAQLGLSEATEAWAETFADADDSITRMIASFKNFSKVSLTYSKEKSKLDEKVEKARLKYDKDSPKRLKAEQEYIKDNSALALSGIGELAGASKSFFSEQTTAYKVLQTIEMAVHLAKMAHMAAELPGQITSLITNIGIGISAQAAIPIAGFVLAPAMAALLLGLTGSSGGGGGGASVSVPSVAGEKQAELDFENKMITDRLDRQIELLEQLNLQGSASKLKNISSGIQFEYEKSSAANNLRAKMEEKVEKWAGSSALNTFNSMISKFGYSGDIISYFEENSPRKLWLEYSNATVMGLANWMSPYIDINQREFQELQNEFQWTISEFISSVVDSVQTVQQEGEKLKDIYDELTDSSKYADERLNKAIKRVDTLRGNYSFAEYIENQIANIELLKDELSDKNISLLLSQDVKDMRAKIELVNQISAKTGLVFENGAEDVLNYIEAIEMVSEAMVTSRNNINSFVESFMSDYDLLEMQSQKMGTGIAKSFDELFLQFQTMASDVVGLTDEELSYLEATKSYLEEQNDKEIEAIEEQIDLQEKLLDTIKKNISTIEGIMNSLKSTIDKLRDNADTTNTYTLNKFYESMAKTQELIKDKDYEAIANSVKETISYSSALSDAKNFTLTRDMQYAQLVAANQFEAMDITLQGELDYLREIEINTRDTVSRLEDMIEALGATIANAFDKNSQAIKNLIAELEKGKEKDGAAVTKLVGEIYTKYDLHQYQTDESGYDYWQNQVMTGALSVAQLETAIKNSAQGILSGSSGGGSSSSSGGGSTSTPSTSDLISNIYDKYDLNQYQNNNSGYDYWQSQVSSGAIAVSDLESAIKAAADEILGINSFAVGTPNVPNDMLANIHKGETIIPTTFSEGLRRGDLMLGETNQLSNLLVDVIGKLNGIIIQQGLQTATLIESRDIQNGSLVMLENIEGII